MNFSEHYFTSFDGIRLYYRAYEPVTYAEKKGPTLLCLAGLSRCCRDFHDFALLMQQKNHRILTLDYRGRGQSDYDPRSQNYHIGTYLEDVRHLLIVENLENVVIVGSSLGGLLAMFMGASMPCSLAGAVLNDIGPVIDSTLLLKIVDVLEKNHSFSTWDEACTHTKKTFPSLEGLSEEQWRQRTERYFTEDSHARITRRFDVKILEPIRSRNQNMHYWHVFESLATTPLLLVRGNESDLLSSSLFQQMQDHIRTKNENCSMMAFEIAEQGHVPDPEHPHFIKTFENFYDQFVVHKRNPCK